MKFAKVSIPFLCAGFLLMCFLTQAVGAEMPDPESYLPTFTEAKKHKATFDDPRPVMKDWPMSEIIPAQLWDTLTYDQEEMKALWAELVGFKAPDVVGKIAPDVGPGKYTYKDLETNPGLRELLIPYFVENIIKPGGPPFVGNIPEFEVITTQQYYWSLPIGKMSKENMGKTKLGENGYYVNGTWNGGFPFPKPSGPHKAQQVMYNYVVGFTTYFSWNANHLYMSPLLGFNKKLAIDNDGFDYIKHMSLAGRALMPPYGFYDARAEKLGELDVVSMMFTAPRDLAGQVMQQTRYIEAEKPTLSLIYIPGLRRVRTLSGTDTQDPVGGQDMITDDLSPKYSPNAYPWKFEIVEEREFLVPANSIDGAEYMTSPEKGGEIHNVKMERRPVYVVQLTQTDKNYVYSKKIYYVDRETFAVHHNESYDQRGRLYRTYTGPNSWYPESGMLSYYVWPQFARDHIDTHSSVTVPFVFPAVFQRSDIKVRGNVMGK